MWLTTEFFFTIGDPIINAREKFLADVILSSFEEQNLHHSERTTLLSLSSTSYSSQSAFNDSFHFSTVLTLLVTPFDAADIIKKSTNSFLNEVNETNLSRKIQTAFGVKTSTRVSEICKLSVAVLLWVTKEMLPTNQIHAIINSQNIIGQTTLYC